MPSLVRIGLVVLEKKLKYGKFTDGRTDRDMCPTNSFQLSRAKKHKFDKICSPFFHQNNEMRYEDINCLLCIELNEIVDHVSMETIVSISYYNNL